MPGEGGRVDVLCSWEVFWKERCRGTGGGLKRREDTEEEEVVRDTGDRGAGKGAWPVKSVFT